MTNESNTTAITEYRNVDTGELAPSHRVGTDESGDTLYLVPEGWEPVEAYWLDEQGLAHASDRDEDLAYAIQAQLERLGAESTEQSSGLDCDEVVNGVASFSDSQESGRYNAREAFGALRSATPTIEQQWSGREGEPVDVPNGFDGAWSALAKLDEVEA